MSIFNIHFFSQVQTRVESAYMGRVFSCIFTLAILFMPLATLVMTLFDSIHLFSFALIGSGVMLLALIFLTFLKKWEE